MNLEGLTRLQVSSHLQHHRKQMTLAAASDLSMQVLPEA